MGFSYFAMGWCFAFAYTSFSDGDKRGGAIQLVLGLINVAVVAGLS